MKTINILWHDNYQAHNVHFRAAIEAMVSNMEDFGYSYDLRNEIIDKLVEILDEIGLSFEIIESEEI